MWERRRALEDEKNHSHDAMATGIGAQNSNTTANVGKDETRGVRNYLAATIIKYVSLHVLSLVNVAMPSQ